jgi:hypothetical protein
LRAPRARLGAAERRFLKARRVAYLATLL